MALNRKLRKLFIQEVINSFAYFAPLTLIAIFLSSHGISSKYIALSMLFGSIATRWGRIVISPILSMVPVYISMSLLQLLGAGGYLLLFFSHSIFGIILAMIMVGLFYGNNSIFIRVLVSTLEVTKMESFNERFAWLHMATNIATSLGPLLFNLLYSRIGGGIAFITLSILMVIMSIYSYFQMNTYDIEKQNAWFKSLICLLLRKDLLPIYFLMVILWFFYAQMFTFAPILLSVRYNMSQLVWVVPATNGIIIVVCSVVFNKKLLQICPNIYLPIIVAFIFSCFGFTLLLFNNNIWGVMLGVGLITCAEIFFIPGFNVLLSHKVSEIDKVAIFAINSLFTGVGEGCGYYFGTVMGFAKGTTNGWSIMLIYASLTLGVAISILLSNIKRTI